MGDGPAYILYVAQDARDPSRFCPGSRRALALVDEADLGSVNVQNVNRLREKATALPAWLTGTPTLVSKASKQAMRGTKAIEHLSALASGKGGGEGGGAKASTDDVIGMTLSNETMHLGVEGNFEPTGRDDPSKYDDSRKITDSEVQRFMDRRKAVIPPR